MTQSALAAAAGISRQSLSAIEAGRTEPAVSTALRIAAALDQSVASLFGDAGAQRAAPTLEAESAEPAKGHQRGEQRVALACIAERWIAYPLAGRTDAALHTASGLARARVIASATRAPSSAKSARALAASKVQVELLQPLELARETVVLAGCAPALGLLAHSLNAERGPGRFLWLEQASAAALRMLKAGHAHSAGVHLQEPRSSEPNVSAVRRSLPKQDLSLITFAVWDAGLVLRAGNPLGIRGVADLARKRLRIAAREPGAGARSLLEQQLHSAGIAPQTLLAGALIARGQLEVAQAVALGAADVGLAMEGAALAYGLDFVPLAQERFDLVLPRAALADPRIARMLDTLNAARFRRELTSLGGYDTAHSGTVAAEIRAA